MKKKCPVCKNEKPIEDFNSQGKCCRECHNERNRRWRENHPKEEAESRRRYDEKFIAGDTSFLWCCGCKKRKMAKSFGWKNKDQNIHSNLCRMCQSKASKAHYQKHKDEYIRRSADRFRVIRQDLVRKILDYLRCHPCVDCGENRPIRLEFDHVRGKKLFNIADALRRKSSWESILKEIEKCDIRCSNCHAEKTAMERQTVMWKMIEEGK